MKIVNKGIINKYSEAEGPVPHNAVKYIDPEAMEREGKGITMYYVMALLIPIIVFSIKYAMIKETPMVFSILGIALGCVLYLPRELLRGMAFPKGSKVELYQMIKPPRMFLTCDKPLGKSQFILANLFPNIVLGLIPLLIWLFISPYTYLARTLFSIGFICVITGGRDYMYISKTLGRVPPFNKIQISGVKMYYFHN